jgi:DNA polymerase family A
MEASMDMEASLILSEVFSRQRPVYIYTHPEILDFTSHDDGKLVLCGGQRRIELDIDSDEIKVVMGTLALSAFDKEVTSTLIAWDLKSLLSYAKHFNNSLPEITVPIFDLQIIENFLGISQPKPTSIVEAVKRLKTASENKSWKSLYHKLHLPLATDVLPAIETYPILNTAERDVRFAHYEIEGQQNGRLRCAKRFEKSYLAHTLGEEQKAVIKPRGYNLSFMVADICNCEVMVLQWLSDDQRLKQIIESGKDLYREIYKVITNDSCNTDNKRKLSQIMFLSVIYGSMAKGLGKSLNVSDETAHELRKRIFLSFPTSMEWLQTQQNNAKNGVSTDYFGRPRNFEDKPYLARNSAVQGVAATACLEKLVTLKRRLDKTPARICFTVHDGYGLVVPNDRIEETAKIVREVLEAPSRLCPGLDMKVKIETGPSLDKMSIYPPEEF